VLTLLGCKRNTPPGKLQRHNKLKLQIEFSCALRNRAVTIFTVLSCVRFAASSVISHKGHMTTSIAPSSSSDSPF